MLIGLDSFQIDLAFGTFMVIQITCDSTTQIYAMECIQNRTIIQQKKEKEFKKKHKEKVKILR